MDGSAFDLYGTNEALAYLESDGGAGVVRNDPAGSLTQTRTLTLRPNAGETRTFSGAIQNGRVATEQLALAVDGAPNGVQALTGANLEVRSQRSTKVARDLRARETVDDYGDDYGGRFGDFHRGP